MNILLNISLQKYVIDDYLIHIYLLFLIMILSCSVLSMHYTDKIRLFFNWQEKKLNYLLLFISIIINCSFPFILYFIFHKNFQNLLSPPSFFGYEMITLSSGGSVFLNLIYQETKSDLFKIISPLYVLIIGIICSISVFLYAF